MCAPYGRKPYVEKVDTIQQMKECASTTDVQRSLGACIFYHIWIHHFAQREREKNKRWNQRNGRGRLRSNCAMKQGGPELQ